MPIRRVWARAQSLSSKVFATCLSSMADVLLGSYVLELIDVTLALEEGRALARTVAMSVAVSLRVVPALPMGMHTTSTRPQYRHRVQSRGLYISVFFVRLAWRPRSMQKPISNNMREQSSRSKESGSGVGSAGTLRA